MARTQREHAAERREKRGSAREQMRLVSASMDGKVDMVRKLLAAGVDPDGPDEARGMPLSFAAMNGHVAIAQALLDAGADPELRLADGHTPLFYAKKLSPEVYRLFKEHGARKTGEAAVRRAADAEEKAYLRQFDAFWKTPLEERRGPAPWVEQYQYFENLLVRAPVPAIKQALLSYEHPRLAPAAAAAAQAPDNTPFRTRQFRLTPLDVLQPDALRLTFARLRGHDWSQMRGGHRAAGARPFSNESLARYLSRELETRAVLYGYEDTSDVSYHQLYDRGRLIEGYGAPEKPVTTARRTGSDPAATAAADVAELFLREGILDPDVYWEAVESADADLLLLPRMPWGDEPGFRREEFAELDWLVVDRKTGERPAPTPSLSS